MPRVCKDIENKEYAVGQEVVYAGQKYSYNSPGSTVKLAVVVGFTDAGLPKIQTPTGSITILRKPQDAVIIGRKRTRR